jgi:hypothetical protein
VQVRGKRRGKMGRCRCVAGGGGRRGRAGTWQAEGKAGRPGGAGVSRSRLGRREKMNADEYGGGRVGIGGGGKAVR